MARKTNAVVRVLGCTIDVEWAPPTNYGGRDEPSINWFTCGLTSLKDTERFHAALGRAIQILRNHTRCEATRYEYSFGVPRPFVCYLQKGHRGLHNSRRDDDKDVIFSLKWSKWADSVDGSDSKARLAYFKKKKAQRRRKRKKT